MEQYFCRGEAEVQVNAVPQTGQARCSVRLTGSAVRLPRRRRGSLGLALGLLDQWLSGHDADVPAGLAKLTRLPAGHWTGERAAVDILTLARKGRAFACLDSLIARQGGQHVLYGSALALAPKPSCSGRGPGCGGRSPSCGRPWTARSSPPATPSSCR